MPTLRILASIFAVLFGEAAGAEYGSQGRRAARLPLAILLGAFSGLAADVEISKYFLLITSSESRRTA
jgi:hypothetical protein